ncbi:unnamed protein product [Larinioides sclopetarius]|uniref:ATP synthase F0 subunit 8 n=1 Tax=Larinioides sclopetarius TaxID=280406 RepID=A0AAV1YU17_9ARAC
MPSWEEHLQSLVKASLSALTCISCFVMWQRKLKGLDPMTNRTLIESGFFT